MAGQISGDLGKMQFELSLNKKAVLLIALLCSVVALSFPSAVKASTQITIVASEDSYVDNAFSGTNYGTSIFLYAHNYDSVQDYVGPLVNTWLKFDLSLIPAGAKVNSIVLRMHTAFWGTRSINTVGVFVSNDNSWMENGITWNNAPAASSSSPAATTDCGAPDLDYTFDLTNALAGKTGTVSLVLKTTIIAKEPAVFDSKEGNDLAQSPTLVVDYAAPLSTSIIVASAVAIIAVVAVLGFFVMKRQRKQPKTQEKQ
jgi:hypothetical protein